MPQLRISTVASVVLLASLVSACGSDSSSEATAPKGCDYPSTFAAIQETIFEAKGCSADVCHGEQMEGDLNLRTDASYEALVRTPSVIDPDILRVFPGDEERSLLYLKVAAATEGTETPGAAMPIGADPLTSDQLEAVRLWIRGGAAEDGIVGGTLELLGCEGMFDPEPNKINPLPAPAVDEGVQFYSGAWDLDAESEDEVCFATYYDFSDQVPADYQVDCPELGQGRKCFAFRRNELAQDGQSHHSIIDIFTPSSDPNGGDWKNWECLGGATSGQPCDPTDFGACGERGQCATRPESKVACVGYSNAPSNFAAGGGFGGGSATTVSLSGAQESTRIDEPPVGVYSLLPLSGFVSWNSHGFNLTKQPTSIEQWVNLTFASEDERQYVRRSIFESGRIFSMSPVAPFEKREVCMTFTLPQHSRLLTLSSHMHARGELFRIWLPPNTPCEGVDTCEPRNSAADYESRFYDDPAYTYYDPPLEYSSDAPAERTFLACAVYDNGADNPFDVKRESTKPKTPSCDHPFGQCGCPPSQRACFGGDNEGMSCGGDDSVCGEGGMCDACPLLGGVTTDDEMFLPLGSYYVAEP